MYTEAIIIYQEKCFDKLDYLQKYIGPNHLQQSYKYFQNTVLYCPYNNEKGKSHFYFTSFRFVETGPKLLNSLEFGTHLHCTTPCWQNANSIIAQDGRFVILSSFPRVWAHPLWYDTHALLFSSLINNELWLRFWGGIF